MVKKSVKKNQYIKRNHSGSPILPTINDIRCEIENTSDNYNYTAYTVCTSEFVQATHEFNHPIWMDNTHTHTVVDCGTELPVVDHPCPLRVILPQHSPLLIFWQGHTKVGVEAALELGACKRGVGRGGEVCSPTQMFHFVYSAYVPRANTTAKQMYILVSP